MRLLDRRRWILVWVCAVEIFAVQALTLAAPHAQNVLDQVVDRVIRFLLDLIVFTILARLLPRALLAAVCILNAAAYAVLILYHDYFQQPLSILTAINLTREGVAVSNAGWALLKPWHAVFAVTLVAKLLLLLRAEPLPRAGGRQLALLLGAYPLGVLLVNAAYRPLAKIRTWQSVGGLGVTYGYTPAWLAEYLLVDPAEQLARALDRARVRTDQLTPIEAPIQIRDRLVLLQVESLDWAVLELRVHGREVTPALNRLAHSSMLFAVQAHKWTGSLDADFTALMGRLPSADVPTYKIPGYSYRGSLPEQLGALGYHTTAIHGVSGEFFNRRPAYEQMGFHCILFKEELEELRAAPEAGWSLQDDEVLQFAARELRAQNGRQFQMVITATSHIPFPTYDRRRDTFFPGSGDLAERYLDVIHYVDESIGRFVDSLPPKTTVVLYGDHISKAEIPLVNYHQAYGDGIGLVPFMVLETGSNLADTQRTRATQVALGGGLTLLDAINWVHLSVARMVRPPGGGGNEAP